MNITEYSSPIGNCVLAEENGALAGLWFEGQKYFPALNAAVHQETAVLTLAKQWLDRYFAGLRPSPDELPLSPKGSEFRKEVLNLLCRIPYGQTTTYAAIAADIAGRRGIARMSAQAVGGAVGHNPISIIIPCHRVLGTGGSLTGYAGGLQRKQWLLAHEKGEADWPR